MELNKIFTIWIITILLVTGVASALTIQRVTYKKHLCHKQLMEKKKVELEEMKNFLQKLKEKKEKGINSREINSTIEVLERYKQGLESKLYSFLLLNKSSKKVVDYEDMLLQIDSEIAGLKFVKKMMLVDATNEVDKLIPPFRRTKDFNVDSPCINITRKKIFDKNMHISRSKGKIYSPSLQSGIDIEAHDLYLSRVPEDKNKNSVVVNPHAGDKLYIHWVYTIKGEGVVPSFHWILRLVTDNDQQIINLKEQETHKEAGYKYILYFENPWVAPGGKYNLSLEVDTDDEVEETNEDNNFIIKSFSVTPTDEKFDLELNDIWMSSKPGDTKKEHTLGSNIWEGTEVYFHVKWTIWGNPNTIIAPYDLRIAEGAEDLPPEINVVETIEEEIYRQTGYIYIAWLQTEEGDGWIANTPGSHYLATEVDSKKKIKEWNENNNFLSLRFQVHGNTVKPNEGDKKTDRGGWFPWLADARAESYPDKCEAGSFANAFLLPCSGEASSSLFYSCEYIADFQRKADLWFSGDFKGQLSNNPPSGVSTFLIECFIIDKTTEKATLERIYYDSRNNHYMQDFSTTLKNYIFHSHHLYAIGAYLIAIAKVFYIFGGAASDFMKGKYGWHLYEITFKWK